MPIYKVAVESNVTRWFNEAGQTHREDGPAVEHSNGDRYWFVNGELHREDGPAVIYGHGSTRWYLNGKLHREDGPAVTHISGRKLWYLNGRRFSEEEFNDRQGKNDCSGRIIEIDGVEYELKKRKRLDTDLTNC